MACQHRSSCLHKSLMLKLGGFPSINPQARRTPSQNLRHHTSGQNLRVTSTVDSNRTQLSMLVFIRTSSWQIPVYVGLRKGPIREIPSMERVLSVWQSDDFRVFLCGAIFKANFRWDLTNKKSQDLTVVHKISKDLTVDIQKGCKVVLTLVPSRGGLLASLS